MLGGTNALNHGYVTRGCPNDYNYWAELTGDVSWLYENFIQYYIKSERLDDEEIIQYYGEYHGTTGPIGIIRQTSDEDKLGDYFAALAQVGNPTVLEINGFGSKGYALAQYILADKMRQSTVQSYLTKVKDNPNLSVSKNTRVLRVIFEGNTAVAVEAVYEGKTYILRANKEIILCAGVFNTPQILMLSGIGHKEHLEAAGINFFHELPVGDKLADHPGVVVIYKTREYLTPPTNPTGLNADLNTVPFAFTTGNVALNCSEECADYLSYDLVLTHDTPPQVVLVCHDTFWYKTEICDNWQRQLSGHDAYYAALLNPAPKSFGNVCLDINDPFGDPVITTGYLTEREDLTNMVHHVKNFIQVGESDFFNGLDASLIALDLTACADKVIYSDEFWECYILNNLFTPFHFFGTCRMGSVVDGDLKIYGLENIRIVDASVIPFLKAAPCAAVIAIAEKASDIIKGTTTQSK